MALPESESAKEPWRHAMDILLEAAEGRNQITLAQLAVNRALSADVEDGSGKTVGPK